MVYEWWKYWNARQELHAAIADLHRVAVIARVGQTAAFTFLTADSVFADSLVVFPFEDHAAFCALQARPHEIWARFFGSTLEERLRYTPSDCFETFPFPESWESDPNLEAAGERYYQHRVALMVRNEEGLTKTYNRFHDPYEKDPGIERLRELHAEMDQAVLDVYGWSDVRTGCEFLLDYEINEEEWGNKRKPYRYRWPDDVRDEVLARLIALNGERAAAERRAGEATAKPDGGRRRRVAASAQAEGLF
jgi:hypothetical protein